VETLVKLKDACDPSSLKQQIDLQILLITYCLGQVDQVLALSSVLFPEFVTDLHDFYMGYLEMRGTKKDPWVVYLNFELRCKEQQLTKQEPDELAEKRLDVLKACFFASAALLKNNKSKHDSEFFLPNFLKACIQMDKVADQHRNRKESRLTVTEVEKELREVGDS